MEIILEVLLNFLGNFADNLVTALPYIYSSAFYGRTQTRRIMTTKPHIVIVAGAFQTEWHYSFLRDELTKAGYEASIVVLPSTGGWTPVPDSLAKDVVAIREAVTKQINAGIDVVVVAHSQGGVGASAAIKELGKKGSSPGVTHILYLQSFLLAPETSANDLLGGTTAPWLDVTSHPGIQIPNDALETFYHDVSDRAVAEKAASLVVPNSRSVVEGRIDWVPWEGEVGCTYVLCEEDRAVPVGVARWLIQSSGFKGKVLRVKSGHSPFLSMPECVAGITQFVAGEEGVDLEALGVRMGDGGDGNVKEGWKEDR